MMLMMTRVSDDGVEMVSSSIPVVIPHIRPTMLTGNVNLKEAGNVIVVGLLVGVVLRLIVKVGMVGRYLKSQGGEHLSK